MANLSEREARLLEQVSSDVLMRHAATIAQWERTSGTPGGACGKRYSSLSGNSRWATYRSR